MIVLGIHFGHDASVSVVKDGVVINCIEVERITRAKHAIGITIREVELALRDASVEVEDIDYCSVTSTQRLEYLFENPEKLSFSVNLSAEHAKYCNRQFTQSHVDNRSHKYLSEVISSGRFHPYLKRVTKSVLDNFANIQSVGTIEDFYLPDDWRHAKSLDELIKTDLSSVITDDNRYGMQLPVDVMINGRTIPGFMMSHHFAHAAYAFYSSNMQSSAIFTHDGSEPGSAYWGGMYYYGEGNALYSVAPHYLAAGHLYERIAFLLNLGYDTGAGKLMGLAPWGKPTFYSDDFVGNWQDGFSAPKTTLEGVAKDAVPEWISDNRHALLYRWLCHCLMKAKDMGYDFSPLGNTEQILSPINVDLAASTQKLIEEILLKAIDKQYDIQDRLGCPTENICLSGGVALNCPANSVLYNRSRFKNVFVPPAVSDGGLSIGGALAITHNVLDMPRSHKKLNASECAYLGRSYDSRDVEDAMKEYADLLNINVIDNAAEFAAKMLSENKVIAWWDGRSETGPRALGHRSILSHPGFKDNWQRVNDIKGREHWRPFAPAVLEDHAHNWFDGMPIPSPFMLFTGQVKTKTLPAITHIDGSARVQTVSRQDGEYYRLLEEFYALTGMPVIMNTSFNGPGEPIVETPTQALEMFSGSDLDALFIPPCIMVQKS